MQGKGDEGGPLMSRLCFVSNFPVDQLRPPVCMLPARKHILIGLIFLTGQFGDHLRLFHCFPWEFHLPLQAAYQRLLFSSLPEKGSGTYFFFFLFWFIASDDLNAPCRLMPGTACWLDVPEFGSDIRLLEMNLSFLHLLSVSQPTFPLLHSISLHAQCTHGREQGCTHIRCLTKN